MQAMILRGDQIETQFAQVRAMFDRCVRKAVRGEFDSDDLLRLAQAQKMYIGVVRDGGEPVMAMAFEFIEYPQRMVLNIAALAGQRIADVMAELWPTFQRFARAAGADGIQASCSPSMARILRRQGFNKVYEVMRSEL